MPGYEEFEATSLFCPRCRKAVPVRKKLRRFVQELLDKGLVTRVK